MNQSILFNDDLHFVVEGQHWQWSAIASGEVVTLILKTSVTPESFTPNHQLDWELEIEEWLSEHDIEDTHLTINLAN